MKGGQGSFEALLFKLVVYMINVRIRNLLPQLSKTELGIILVASDRYQKEMKSCSMKKLKWETHKSVLVSHGGHFFCAIYDKKQA